MMSNEREPEGHAIQQTQRTGPEDGDRTVSECDPRHPTAIAPDGVGGSVCEEAEFAGSEGPNAADDPIAAGKSRAESVEPPGPDAEPDPQAEPGADLDPEEAADLMETQEEAHRIKQTRDDQREEGLISLDTPD